MIHLIFITSLPNATLETWGCPNLCLVSPKRRAAPLWIWTAVRATRMKCWYPWF